MYSYFIRHIFFNLFLLIGQSSGSGTWTIHDFNIFNFSRSHNCSNKFTTILTVDTLSKWPDFATFNSKKEVQLNFTLHRITNETVEEEECNVLGTVTCNSSKPPNAHQWNSPLNACEERLNITFDVAYIDQSQPSDLRLKSTAASEITTQRSGINSTPLDNSTLSQTKSIVEPQLQTETPAKLNETRKCPHSNGKNTSIYVLIIVIETSIIVLGIIICLICCIFNGKCIVSKKPAIATNTKMTPNQSIFLEPVCSTSSMTENDSNRNSAVVVPQRNCPKSHSARRVRPSALLAYTDDISTMPLNRSAQQPEGSSNTVSNTSGTVTAGQNSSTIHSIDFLFDKAKNYQASPAQQAELSNIGIQTLSETVKTITNSANKMNSRAEKSTDSDPVPIEELPINMLKRIWRIKKREKKKKKENNIL